MMTPEVTKMIGLSRESSGLHCRNVIPKSPALVPQFPQKPERFRFARAATVDAPAPRRRRQGSSQPRRKIKKAFPRLLFENSLANNAEESEEFDVINISKLKSVNE